MSGSREDNLGIHFIAGFTRQRRPHTNKVMRFCSSNKDWPLVLILQKLRIRYGNECFKERRCNEGSLAKDTQGNLTPGTLKTTSTATDDFSSKVTIPGHKN